MNDHLVGEAGELSRQPLYALNKERGVRQPGSPRTPSAVRESIGARVDRDREEIGLAPRSVQNVATVARTYVHQNARVGGG